MRLYSNKAGISSIESKVLGHGKTIDLLCYRHVVCNNHHDPNYLRWPKQVVVPTLMHCGMSSRPTAYHVH